jgi:hypothetical protein
MRERRGKFGGYVLPLPGVWAPELFRAIDHEHRNNYRVTFTNRNGIPHLAFYVDERLAQWDYIVFYRRADRALNGRVQTKRLAHDGVKKGQFVKCSELSLVERGIIMHRGRKRAVTTFDTQGGLDIWTDAEAVEDPGE